MATRGTITLAKTLLLALGMLLLATCAAPAATVGPVRVSDGLYSGVGLRFKAAPGEINEVSVVSSFDTVTFRDTRNRVAARGRCQPLDVHTVRCPRSRVSTALVRLGDRSDRVKVTRNRGNRTWLPYRELVRGGTGDDVVQSRGHVYGGVMSGGAGDDTLRGGRGNERLVGGPGRDVLDGGRGDDDLRDGESDTEAAVDRFDGGRGGSRSGSAEGDTLSFRGRRGGLIIDLLTGTTSSGDTLVRVDHVVGGRGDDALLGNAQQNYFVGGPGADVMHGRGGGDWLSGGNGDDRLFGDEGDDSLSGDRGADALSGGIGDDRLDSASEHFDDTRARNDPSADVLTCDAGVDFAESDSLDTITTECESVSPFSDLTLRSVPAIDVDSADFALICSIEYRDEHPACGGTISLSGPDGRPYGSAPFTMTGVVEEDDTWVEAVVAVPLSEAGRTALQAGTLVQVDVVSDDRNAARGGYRIFLCAG